mgnify:FL=1
MISKGFYFSSKIEKNKDDRDFKEPTHYYLRVLSPWRPNQRLILTFHCKGIFFTFDSVLAFTNPPPKYCSQNVWFRFAVILQDMNVLFPSPGA